MTPIHHRTQLIDLARQYAPTRACATAFSDGTVIVLGGFDQGWIVEVRSRRGTRWFINVQIDETNRKYIFTYPESVPWGRWNGNAGGEPGVRNGDDPHIADCNRWNARVK